MVELGRSRCNAIRRRWFGADTGPLGVDPSAQLSVGRAAMGDPVVRPSGEVVRYCGSEMGEDTDELELNDALAPTVWVRVSLWRLLGLSLPTPTVLQPLRNVRCTRCRQHSDTRSAPVPGAVGMTSVVRPRPGASEDVGRGELGDAAGLEEGSVARLDLEPGSGNGVFGVLGEVAAAGEPRPDAIRSALAARPARIVGGDVLVEAELAAGTCCGGSISCCRNWPGWRRGRCRR